ncbi:NAD(P)-dependent oxidoreductase [Pseudomonas putida]
MRHSDKPSTTPQTEGIINVETLSYLPVGAGIVNVGRGEHVVEQDMLAALESGSLGGAVLDVLRDEPPSQHHPFWNNPRVIMTPHIANNVKVDGSVEIIKANLNYGHPLINEVCRARGY